MTTREYLQICRDHKWEDAIEELCSIVDSLHTYPDSGRSVCEGLESWADKVWAKRAAYRAEISRTPDESEIAARFGHEMEDE